MKSYAKQAVAKAQATRLTTNTGIKHMFAQDGDSWMVGTEQEIDEAFALINKKAEKRTTKKEVVTHTFEYKGEDAKYLKVGVGSAVFKIGKRLAQFAIHSASNLVTVTMSKKYAEFRTELKVL